MVSGEKDYFKTNLDTESVQGIWYHHKGDSTATDLVDALVSDLFKEKDSVFQDYFIGSSCNKKLF